MDVCSPESPGRACVAKRMSPRTSARCHNVSDVRRAAKRALPRPLFDFVDGSADDEQTMNANRSAFSSVTFRPRMAVDVPNPDLSTTVVGSSLALPILLAPCGMIRSVHPDAEPGVARAAASRGTVSILSSAAGTSLETVAKSTPGTSHWFQLYFLGGRSGALDLMRRAADAGFTTLVVTVDTPMPGNRERDVRNGLSQKLGVNLASARSMGPHIARHPRWFYGFLRDGLPLSFGNMPASTAGITPLLATTMLQVAQPSWEDIAWARREWNGPLLVKGLTTGDDARRALEGGADGVIVSNHGGRQLDGLPASLYSLIEVVEELQGEAELLLDGGIRRGSDVAKALALGATAVIVGRPYVYGLAIGGQSGVDRVLEILATELSRTLRLLGCPSVRQLDSSWVDGPSVQASARTGQAPAF